MENISEFKIFMYNYYSGEIFLYQFKKYNLLLQLLLCWLHTLLLVLQAESRHQHHILHESFNASSFQSLIHQNNESLLINIICKNVFLFPHQMKALPLLQYYQPSVLYAYYFSMSIIKTLFQRAGLI